MIPADMKKYINIPTNIFCQLSANALLAISRILNAGSSTILLSDVYKRQDLVTINGTPVRGWMTPAVGDELTVTLPEETCDYPPEDIPIDVIFEDSDLLVINKQPGYVVHPTKGKPTHTIANGIMKKMLDSNERYKIRFANRLDMNTSGLLIIAKNGFAQEHLIRQMKRDSVQKRYLAVVDGIISNDCGTIDKPIGRPDPNEVERWILPVADGGYDSITHYQVKERFESGYTLVELRLETGRTHQIRVHMASIGHSVTDVYKRQAAQSLMQSFARFAMHLL